MAYEKTFAKIVAFLLPLVFIFFIFHLVIFFFAWFFFGIKDPRFQGRLGIVRYYFFTWKESFIGAKNIYEQKDERKDEIS